MCLATPWHLPFSHNFSWTTFGIIKCQEPSISMPLLFTRAPFVICASNFLKRFSYVSLTNEVSHNLKQGKNNCKLTRIKFLMDYPAPYFTLPDTLRILGHNTIPTQISMSQSLQGILVGSVSFPYTWDLTFFYFFCDGHLHGMFA